MAGRDLARRQTLEYSPEYLSPTIANRMPSATETLDCWVYRSSKKDEMYLYLGYEGDFDSVPSELLKRFGTPQLVMSLELHSGRGLAREDVLKVMANLRERGYHLQLPPRTDAAALPEYRH
jgi:uncharacterized protein YcgL (UPF0745 family)